MSEVTKEFLYRYEDYLVSAGVDEFDNPLGPPSVKVSLRKFSVIKKTPKGVWIDIFLGKRFVLSSARKRYACQTVEEAKDSFIARKNRQIHILGNRIKHAEEAIEKVKSDGIH